MPRLRSRAFEVTQKGILQVLDADDSDEEGLLDIDDEDLNILDLENPEEERVEVVIDDPSVHPVQPMETEDVEPTKSIKWSKKCPPLSIPDPVPGLGRVTIQFRAEFPDPLPIFEMVCDLDTLLDTIIIPQSVLYKSQRGEPFTTTTQEIRAFLGIVFMMSYHVLPSFKHYWSTDPDVHVPVIANVMPRQRFFEIRTALHFADNNQMPDHRDPNRDGRGRSGLSSTTSTRHSSPAWLLLLARQWTRGWSSSKVRAS